MKGYVAPQHLTSDLLEEARVKRITLKAVDLIKRLHDLLGKNVSADALYSGWQKVLQRCAAMPACTVGPAAWDGVPQRRGTSEWPAEGNATAGSLLMSSPKQCGLSRVWRCLAVHCPVCRQYFSLLQGYQRAAMTLVPY